MMIINKNHAETIGARTARRAKHDESNHKMTLEVGASITPPLL
jgi:hypothetical protein